MASLQSALADRYRIERELGQGGMATAERFVQGITTTAQRQQAVGERGSDTRGRNTPSDALTSV